MSIYAVNGKEPIAAWIPSRDTAGNGTTTLTDLVGSNNGTLTNMDAATDWVADTDAGGVRALDFGNQEMSHVNFGNLSFGVVKTISLWIKFRELGGSQWIFNNRSQDDNTVNCQLFSTSTRKLAVGARNTDGSQPVLIDLPEPPTVDVWHHTMFAMTTNTLTYYYDSVLVGSDTLANGVFADNGSATFRLGTAWVNTDWTFKGAVDDVRIFDQTLDAADASAINASGLGRGNTAGGTIQTRRRRELIGGGL